MKPKGTLSSPLRNPHPLPDINGDRRDTHDHNPSPNLQEPHSKDKRVPSNDFVEGMPGNRGRVGPVDKIAEDIVASPMQGQRRSATGQYESVKRRDIVIE